MCVRTVNRVRRLSLFDVEVFVLLSRNLNANQVAEKMDVFPSKISRCLTCLREVLNDTLFVRKKSGFEPTKLAIKLYPIMDEILSASSNISSINSADDFYQDKTKVRISIPPVLGAGLMSFLKERALSSGDDIDIAIAPWCGFMPPVSEAKVVDIGIYFSVAPIYGIDSSLVCYNEAAYLAAAEGHPIWDSYEDLGNAVLEHPFIVSEIASFNDVRDPLESYAKVKGRSLDVEARASSLEDIIGLLRNGSGFTFFLGKACQKHLDSVPGIKTRKIKESHRQMFIQAHGPHIQRRGVYLACNNRKECPPWLIKSIMQFLHDSIDV